MKQFIAVEKMSKKAKKEYAASRRGSWGAINPVTRRPAKPKAYNRNAAKRMMLSGD